jgi:hypothetical protein
MRVKGRRLAVASAPARWHCLRYHHSGVSQDFDGRGLHRHFSSSYRHPSWCIRDYCLPLDLCGGCLSLDLAWWLWAEKDSPWTFCPAPNILVLRGCLYCRHWGLAGVLSSSEELQGRHLIKSRGSLLGQTTQGCFIIKLFVAAAVKTVAVPTLSVRFATFTAPLAG